LLLCTRKSSWLISGGSVLAVEQGSARRKTASSLLVTFKCLDGIVLHINIGVSLQFLQTRFHLLLQIPTAAHTQHNHCSLPHVHGRTTCS